jgi:hypothetical protein
MRPTLILLAFILGSCMLQVSSTTPPDNHSQPRMLQSSDTTFNGAPINNCTAGCMICSTIDICLLCDIQNFYLPSGFTCKKNVIEGCVLTANGVTCLACGPDYYLGKFLTTRQHSQQMHKDHNPDYAMPLLLFSRHMQSLSRRIFLCPRNQNMRQVKQLHR